MIYFILNPNTQSSNSASVWNRVATQLKQLDVAYKVFPTKHSGHAKEIARQISTRDPNATIVTVGGDGTIHDTLSGLTNLDSITFGLIPSGSGNDFARGMHISKDPDKALAAILHPQRITTMDLGLLPDMQGERFGVSCGIGFDASVCHEVNASKIKNRLNSMRLGNLTYTAVALKQMALYEPGPMHITLDGGRSYDFPAVFFIAVMNQKYEGGGMKMIPDASPTDGALDVIVCADSSRAGMLTVLPLAFAGRHTHLHGLHFLKCEEIQITADKKRPIHLDGESGGLHRHLHVCLEKQQLNVITG